MDFDFANFDWSTIDIGDIDLPSLGVDIGNIVTGQPTVVPEETSPSVETPPPSTSDSQPSLDFANFDWSTIDIGDIDLPSLGVDIGNIVTGQPTVVSEETVPKETSPSVETPVVTSPAETPVVTPPAETPVVAPPAETPVETINTASAFQILKDTLQFYGLDDPELITDIQKLWTNKTIGPTSSIDDIGVQLRDSAAFQKRFPANKALADAKKPQYSISQYLKMEADYKRVMQSANLPTGFYDTPDDFQNLIIGDVSPNELQGRVDLGYQAVNNASPTVIAQFEKLYGIKKGDLAAYFIDPERARPTLDKYAYQRQAQAAGVAAQAQQQADIQLTAETSESLVRAGITQESQAQQGFAEIGAQQEVYTAMKEGEENITQQEQIAGVFGTEAAARKKIEKRRALRKSAFETGGGFTTTQTGVSSLGTAGQ